MAKDKCVICDAKKQAVKDLCKTCHEAMSLVEFNPVILIKMSRYLKYERGPITE